MTIAKSTTTLRASAALPAAGALDPTGDSIIVDGSSFVQFYFTYTRGDPAGRCAFIVEGSLDGVSWFQLQIVDPSTLSAGQIDTADLVVRLPVTTSAVHNWTVGQDVTGFRRIRVRAKEVGSVGSPGTLVIQAAFSNG